MRGLKAVWIVIVLILIAEVSIVAYSVFLKPVENETVEIEVNVCLHLSDYGCSTVSHLTELGVKWVRTDWVLTDDNLMGAYSHDLQEHGFNLLAILNMSTFGDQVDLGEWNETVRSIVFSEGFNNTDAVEICNEPNNADYFIPNGTYYEMLKSAYVIVKNYSDIPVVFAGVSPNVDGWQDYLSSVFAYGDTEDYFDYMGIHFYDDNQTTNLETLHFVEGLTSKPIWLTETGKPSDKLYYNVTNQAKYLDLVYSKFEPLVNKIFIYELKDNPNLWDIPEGYFGLLTADGIQKESYWVICDINGE